MPRLKYLAELRRILCPVRSTVNFDEIDTSTVTGCTRYLTELIRAIERGEIESQTAAMLIRAVSAQSRILEVSDLEKRIEAIEETSDALYDSFMAVPGYRDESTQ